MNRDTLALIVSCVVFCAVVVQALVNQSIYNENKRIQAQTEKLQENSDKLKEENDLDEANQEKLSVLTRSRRLWKVSEMLRDWNYMHDWYAKYPEYRDIYIKWIKQQNAEIDELNN